MQSRFGQSGAVRELNLVQIVVEVSAIRGGLPSTETQIGQLISQPEKAEIRVACRTLRSIHFQTRRLDRFHTNRTEPTEKIKTGVFIKGGPEPLENEINKILGSKREDRFSDHFSNLVQNICSVRFAYRLRLSIFCKAPWDMQKFPQKCQKIAGC